MITDRLPADLHVTLCHKRLCFAEGEDEVKARLLRAVKKEVGFLKQQTTNYFHVVTDIL